MNQLKWIPFFFILFYFLTRVKYGFFTTGNTDGEFYGICDMYSHTMELSLFANEMKKQTMSQCESLILPSGLTCFGWQLPFLFKCISQVEEEADSLHLHFFKIMWYPKEIFHAIDGYRWIKAHWEVYKGQSTFHRGIFIIVLNSYLAPEINRRKLQITHKNNKELSNAHLLLKMLSFWK